LFRVDKVTTQEEEEMIRKAADKICEHGMDLPAVLFLQSFKPLAYVGGQLGRFMVFPFLYVLGGSITQGAEKFFMIFENRNNLEKLIKLVEENTEKKDLAKNKKGDSEKKAKKPEKTQPKRSWRRLLPF